MLANVNKVRVAWPAQNAVMLLGIVCDQLRGSTYQKYGGVQLVDYLKAGTPIIGLPGDA